MSPRKTILTLSMVFALIAMANGAELKVGDPFPDLQQFGLTGEIPKELRGKVVLVDFWASWCVPCKQSFPVLNELSSKYGNRGFVVIGISVDESKTAMQKFLKSTPAEFSILHDAKQKLVQQVNVASMPTSFILDTTGKVRFIHDGFHGKKTQDEYVREIESLLPNAANK